MGEGMTFSANRAFLIFLKNYLLICTGNIIISPSFLSSGVNWCCHVGVHYLRATLFCDTTVCHRAKYDGADDADDGLFIMRDAAVFLVACWCSGDKSVFTLAQRCYGSAAPKVSNDHNQNSPTTIINIDRSIQKYTDHAY